MVSGLFRGLVHFENLVGYNTSQDLNNTTWPANLYLLDFLELPGSEMYGHWTRGRVAYRRGHVIPLIAQPDYRTYPISVTSGTNQSENQPVIDIRGDVLPELGRFTQSAHRNADSSVVVEIRKDAPAVGPRQIKASFSGNVLKCSVPKIGEDTIGLFVVRGLK